MSHLPESTFRPFVKLQFCTNHAKNQLKLLTESKEKE